MMIAKPTSTHSIRMVLKLPSPKVCLSSSSNHLVTILKSNMYMIYFLIHYLYIVSLLAVDVGNDEVEGCTGCYKVGYFLTFQHLVHCPHQG